MYRPGRRYRSVGVGLGLVFIGGSGVIHNAADCPGFFFSSCRIVPICKLYFCFLVLSQVGVGDDGQGRIVFPTLGNRLCQPTVFVIP